MNNNVRSMQLNSVQCTYLFLLNYRCKYSFSCKIIFKFKLIIYWCDFSQKFYYLHFPWIKLIFKMFPCIGKGKVKNRGEKKI